MTEHLFELNMYVIAQPQLPLEQIPTSSFPKTKGSCSAANNGRGEHVLGRQGGSKTAADSFKAQKHQIDLRWWTCCFSLLQLTELKTNVRRAPALLIMFCWNTFQYLFGLGSKCGAAVAHAVPGSMYVTRTER